MWGTILMISGLIGTEFFYLSDKISLDTLILSVPLWLIYQLLMYGLMEEKKRR